MRTLIDLDDDAVLELDRIAKKEKTSRAALIRRGVALLLQERKQPDLERAFGLWTDERDGVAYQRDLRAEW